MLIFLNLVGRLCFKQRAYEYLLKRRNSYYCHSLVSFINFHTQKYLITKKCIFKFKRALKWENLNFIVLMCHSPWIFGDTGYFFVFGKEISWNSVTTLLIAWVGLERQTNTFFSLNEPQSGENWIQLFLVFYSP